ncbi:MAG TPA: type II toxin-antitoxin system prevent-host-death family antitoxin [Ktedonobacterales bacterium]|nr:type II toxin-antitoxin system prevent-host-death family antitoxin [Ktedonobacterales bacterium]
MSTTMSISEARDQLTRLSDELAQSHEAVTVTRRNEPVLAILPWDLYEVIMETLEVMSDVDLTAALRQSVEDIAAGRTLSLDEFERDLG